MESEPGPIEIPGNKKRVLITGAGGRIGRSLAERLGARYDLRLLYHRTAPEAHQAALEQARASGRPVPLDGSSHQVFAGDIADLEAMERACDGIDAVAHMAANPSPRAPWVSILRANVEGTYNVYEGALRAGTRKIVFASSNHATGYYEREGTYTTPELPPRPDSYYGVSKAFGETLARYYVDRHGLSILCLRIGSFQPRPTIARQLATWISHRDTAQLVWRCIETDVPYGVFYGISGNTRAYWDIGNARTLLGYAPDDNAEDYAAEVLQAPGS